MTVTTALLPGVHAHGNGFRLRMRFAGERFITPVLATPAQANALQLEWTKLRDAGLKPTVQVDEPEPLLREAAETLLARKSTTVSRKTGRRLRPRSLEWWERILEPWIRGELAELELSLLRRNSVEDLILARALTAPKVAGDELYALKAVLRHARSRGHGFDATILDIDPVARVRRERQAIGAAELVLLAACAPVYARQMLLFKGTVGLRIDELFTLTDDRVFLDDACILIPAELCKEAVEKWIELTAEEVGVLRAALLARAPGARNVFPTRTGLSWHGRYGEFHKLVWAKAVRRAAERWRADRGLDRAAETPFGRIVGGELDWLEPHDLRATAATLMRDAGFPREEASYRLGHADSGRLLDRIYDRGDRRARQRRAIATFAPAGLLAAVKGEPPAVRYGPPAGSNGGLLRTAAGAELSPSTPLLEEASA